MGAFIGTWAVYVLWHNVANSMVGDKMNDFFEAGDYPDWAKPFHESLKWFREGGEGHKSHEMFLAIFWQTLRGVKHAVWLVFDVLFAIVSLAKPTFD